VFYRGSVGNNMTNAEWFLASLLNNEEVDEETKRCLDKEHGEARVPEWETYYPERTVLHDHDMSGTTVTLSTADMIHVRWNLPLVVCMEMGLFADLIVKDFINYWYNESISKEPQFPDDVRSVLQNVLGKLGDRILSVNLPMFLLCDVSYVLRHHIRWFSALRERASNRCRPKEEFENLSQEDRNKLILEEFRRAGHLHPACSINAGSGGVGVPREDPRTTRYIRSVTCELLVRLLPEEDYNCAALRHLVREVLTCNVLVPALETITPDVLNSAILSILRGEGEKQTGATGEEEEEEEAKDIVDEKEPGEAKVLEECEKANEEMENEKCSESIAFIAEASTEIRKEEVDRLLMELHSSLDACISKFTQNPDQKLGADCLEARKLLVILDTILRHGMNNFKRRQSFDDGVRDTPCEPWWEFVRYVSKLLDPAAMSTDSVDAVVEALYLVADSGKDFLDGENTGNETIGSQPQLKQSTPIIVDTSTGEDSLTADILSPGQAWFAVMLKHKLLAQALEALVKDSSWADLHYTDSAAVRSEKLIPSLASLNGVDFDFDLDPFWRNAALVRKRLEVKGIKFNKHQKLVRMRRRLQDKLKKKVNLNKKTSKQGKIMEGKAIIALQDRVGPIKANIRSFTVKRDKGIRSHTYVQYIIQLELVRREDSVVSTWVIARRYSQFHELHSTLRSTYGHRFGDLQLPGKGGFAGFGSQNLNFITKRKGELQNYLDALLDHPIVCDSEQVLTFLSPQNEEELQSDMGSKIQDSKVDDQIAAAAQSTKRELKKDIKNQRKQNKSKAKKQSKEEPTIDPHDLRIAEGHIYNLAQEVFEFNELGVIRRNIISIGRSVISVAFHGTAHKWLKDNYTRNASAQLFATLLGSVRELLWPNGEFMETEEEDIELSPEEIARQRQTREECLEELKNAIPPAMNKFLGTEKSHLCVHKLHEFLQHPSLIQNLVFTTMDLLVLRIFPDLPLKDLHQQKNKMH